MCLSLNENMLKGPEHTGTLISVLLKFQQFRVTFLADVKFAKVQQAFKLLWFQNGDSSKKIIDMHIKSQAFGVTS